MEKKNSHPSGFEIILQPDQIMNPVSVDTRQLVTKWVSITLVRPTGI